MQIARFKISNFKSFYNIDSNLSNLNVIIGQNAAGKSNLLAFFRFIKNISLYGLNDALEQEGGFDYTRNLNISEPFKPIEFEITFKPGNKYIAEFNTKGKKIILKPKEFNYSISFKSQKDKLEVTKDKLIRRYHVYEYGKDDKEYIADGSIDLNNVNGEIKIDISSTLKSLGFTNDLLFKDEKIEKLKANDLLIHSNFYFLPHEKELVGSIKNLPIYDFVPSLIRQPQISKKGASLHQNGGNLACVLNDILSDEESNRSFHNILNDIMPEIKSVESEKILLDKYQIFIREKYNDAKRIPATLTSSGTMYILSLIVALYFDNNPIAVFEEPERRIHPSLLPKITEMMKDAANFKQIIISTHNPEIVKYADLKDLIFIHRDENGFSHLKHLHEIHEIKAFIENDVEIDELFVRNMLNL
jgi:predicted ATPase